MKKRRKLKKKAVVVLLLILFIIIFGSITITNKIKEYNYHKTIEYKLLNLGYSKEEINILKEKTNTKFMNSLLEIERDENYFSIINDIYYIKDNLDDYIAYYESHLNTKPDKVVTKVNIHATKDWYEETKETDTSKDTLIINNKYYKLSKDYVPEDLIDVSNWYSYGKQQLSKRAYEPFLEMFNKAKEEDITLIINSGYRSYDYQEELYNSYIKRNGQKETDNYAARAGHSEHQTGLAMDLTTYGYNADNFHESKAYSWLQDHAHEYGFIMRYPKDKEDITGYKYESWHYRYVGVEVATFIHTYDITYDEYYAYYIEHNMK